jgi:hypothetical protein
MTGSVELKYRIFLKYVGRELARRLPLRFSEWVYPGFQVAPHHELIASKLEDILAGKTKRLIISMPPRHGKSLMASELFPALWLARNPDKQIIHVSYASMLSNDFSRKVRAMIRDNAAYRELFPHMTLDPERARIDDWKLTIGGGFKSIGVQGGVTGHGADLLIIDDPVKEGDEHSMVTLDAIWEWYLSAARTRMHPHGVILVIMTRWHPLDLVGRLLELAGREAAADQWEHLVLPALALEDDLLGRSPGEALWPERVSREDLLAIKSLSERYFEALYQQNPSVSGSVMFREGDFAREMTDWSSRAAWCFDLASTEKSRSDYNVIGRWSRDEGQKLRLEYVERFRAEWPEVRRRILQLAALHGDDVFVFPKHVLELLAIQTLRDDFPGVLVGEVTLPNDRVERAMPYAALVESGRAVVCPGADGDYFVWEHAHFPDAVRHDDCVAMSSVATHWFGFNRRFDWLIAYGEGKDGVSDELSSDVPETAAVS